jgi:adenylosuccinate lyase
MNNFKIADSMTLMSSVRTRKNVTRRLNEKGFSVMPAKVNTRPMSCDGAAGVDGALSSVSVSILVLLG